MQGGCDGRCDAAWVGNPRKLGERVTQRRVSVLPWLVMGAWYLGVRHLTHVTAQATRLKEVPRAACHRNPVS